MTAEITLIPFAEFARVRRARLDEYDGLTLVADMCRANALASVKRAGSGHLGSSFSALDIVTFLYHSEMNVADLGVENPDRDIYFSSKGHDVPAQYAILHSLGILSSDQLMRLRRIDGTCGHPDVRTPGIEANSGSLGMGISKAKGIAFAKARGGHGGRVFVMTGDGELQEGQIYEALQTAVQQRITNLNVIVDHNKVQSDKRVDEITSLGDLEAKFAAFGWYVARCDGHDFAQLAKVFADFATIVDKPKVLIADTIKGRGVSFMEHPVALEAHQGLYPYHSGAPSDQKFARAYAEIINRINARLAAAGLELLALEEVPAESRTSSGVSREYVADAFGQALGEAGRRRGDLVVLDADLSADCRLRGFETSYPERFIENGIAEQDMISMAGGLALQGLLPVVNTFASFLAARGNEQIYTNATEHTRVIYVCHYAGLIPAGPGQSHQSVRDVSLFAALPNFEIIQPCNAAETRMALDYCIDESAANCMLRLIIGPSPRIIELSEAYRLTPGRGTVLRDGDDAVLFAYGPVMLHEALVASDKLAVDDIGLRVVNMPWLNVVDAEWLGDTVGSRPAVYVVEDHAPQGALGDRLLETMTAHGMATERRFRKFAVEGCPAWGTPSEVLAHHGLDGASLARAILGEAGGNAT